MELSLQNLNDKQLEAVKTTEGPVLVVAGAGSAKTKVLATRIAYLIDGIGCPDRNILAITFTNLACREMKSRVFSILNRPCNAQILTYHGLCLRILREDISVYGMDKNFNIIDDEEQSEIIKQIYQDWRLRDEFGKRCKIKMMLDFIRAIQSSCNCIERTFWDKNIDIPDQVNDLIKRHILHNGDDKYIKSIYLEYIKRKFKGNLLDYNDLITGAYKLLKYNPEIAKKWQQRFQYILVDEFQDTDYFQFQILQMLINSQENVFCVGDPDQTIYEWRGAYVEIFNDFLARFQNTKQIILDKNYRSTQNILDVANSLIKHNEKRIDKTLIAHNANGEKPIYYEGDSKNEEGRFVVNTIKELVKKGYAYKDIAILYRANFLSRFIEQALLYANIPYCIYGGVKFYQRKEIKDVLAYIRLIENPDDELAIKRVINTPNRKIGDVTIDKIANLDVLAGTLSGGNQQKVVLGKWLNTDSEIFIFDEHYQKAMSNKDIANMIKYKGYSKERIVGDSSEPKSIDDIKRQGIYRLKGARKGKDSILNGIQYIQDFKIYVHPKCENTLIELSNYVWDTKEGNVINKPIDDYNHLMDALRYSLEDIRLGGVKFDRNKYNI